MPTPSQLLRMESLERRENPATGSGVVGTPWADANALTLSFAPDGTPLGTTTSNLAAVMKSAGSKGEWQREVLRAFQTWAAQTNANIAVVADGMQAFGTPGDRQGDNRFGDIRIGAAPQSADSLATATPHDPSVGTWSGDVVFNSGVRFTAMPGGAAGRYDLYTTALHEAGHVFGLGHSDDPSSALTERYSGVKAGLTPEDVAAVQRAYGVRRADQYEGATGNGTFQTATPVVANKYTALLGDLTTLGDTDVYSFAVSGKSKNAVFTMSTAGLSAATVAAEVYDAAGTLLARSTPTDPLKPADFTFDLPKSKGDTTYFVRVSSPAADAFAVGRYSLTFNPDSKKSPAEDAPLVDVGLDNFLATATQLQAVSAATRTASACPPHWKPGRTWTTTASPPRWWKGTTPSRCRCGRRGRTSRRRKWWCTGRPATAWPCR